MIYLKWKAKGFKVKLKMGVDNAQSQESTLQKKGFTGAAKTNRGVPAHNF